MVRKAGTNKNGRQAASNGRRGRSDAISNNTEPLEASLGYVFKNKTLLIRALTHSSYINEHKLTRLDCNERLEFLGDAVLELVSSDCLYNSFTESPEGELTKKRASMVSETPLAEHAKKLGLGNWLRLAKGADEGGGRTQPSILSDALESVIGAIYLDGGFQSARSFVMDHVLDQQADENKILSDSKTELQEMVQARFCVEPEYILTSATGPDHDRVFVSKVLVKGVEMGKGSGRSKKQSEQAAAADAILKYKKSGEDN
jgi:ribonuclease-3